MARVTCLVVFILDGFDIGRSALEFLLSLFSLTTGRSGPVHPPSYMAGTEHQLDPGSLPLSYGLSWPPGQWSV